MKIERQPSLPATGERSGKPQGADTPQPVSPRQGARFDALLGRRSASTGKGLRGEVALASALQALDPAVFADTRALAVLGHILEEVLPRLGLEPEIHTLADDLLREEIHLRQWLQGQRGEAQA